MPKNFETWQKTCTFKFNPNITNSKKFTPKHSLLKVLKTEDQGKFLKAVPKDKNNLTDSSFSSEITEAGRKRHLLKGEKKRNFKPKSICSKNILSE